MKNSISYTQAAPLHTFLASHLINSLMSRMKSHIPHSVTCLGNGIISLHIPEFSNRAVNSIDIGDIQFRDDYAVMALKEIELDILACPMR